MLPIVIGGGLPGVGIGVIWIPHYPAVAPTRVAACPVAPKKDSLLCKEVRCGIERSLLAGLPVPPLELRVVGDLVPLVPPDADLGYEPLLLRFCPILSMGPTVTVAALPQRAIGQSFLAQE